MAWAWHCVGFGRHPWRFFRLRERESVWVACTCSLLLQHERISVSSVFGLVRPVRPGQVPDWRGAKGGVGRVGRGLWGSLGRVFQSLEHASRLLLYDMSS